MSSVMGNVMKDVINGKITPQDLERLSKQFPNKKQKEGKFMTEKEIIDAIKYMQKYQTETDKLEAKTAEKVAHKNVMIQFLHLLINMVEL